jgi:hypothetical protein
MNLAHQQVLQVSYNSMLKQEELDVIRTLSSGDISPAFYKQITVTIRKKRPAAAGKRKVIELAGDGSDPATWRLATGTGSAPQKLQTQETMSEQSTSDVRQIGSPKDRLSYAAATATPPATCIPSRPLKPSAKSSDSEPAVFSETATGRMSNNMSGPLNGTPVGTTTNAHVTNNLPAGQRQNKTPIYIIGPG